LLLLIMLIAGAGLVWFESLSLGFVVMVREIL
jgi:hypothetical protein